MTAIREAVPPAQPLYRIGRLPDPLAWPLPQYCGSGRFDDSLGQFSTLYAGEQRRSCFVESLSKHRASTKALAGLKLLMATPDPTVLSIVPIDWCVKRGLARFVLRPGQRWLDLRSVETRETLRLELAETLLQLGVPDLDVSSVLSLNRELTQAIARWAFERGYRGVAYKSRFDDELDCWAIFQGAALDQVGTPELILPSDPDFLETLLSFNLKF